MEYSIVSQQAAILGEGPFWHQGQLHWVDIISRKLHSINAGIQQCLYQGDMAVTAAVPHSEGGFAITLEDGFYHLVDDQLKELSHFKVKADSVRFNDGKCDAKGRFWAGTMARSEDEFIASLYILDKQGQVREVLSEICISNGLCWHGDTFYYIDSARQAVEAFDVAPSSLELSKRRTVYKIPEDDVYPDGMCIDEDGNLWVALWNGHGVICIDAISGKVLKKLDMPCRKATSCCFGGENLDELYVTSDQRGEDLDMYPLSGHVFKFTPGVKGLPTVAYGSKR